MKTQKPKLSRRHFLLAAGVAAAAGVTTTSRDESGDTTSRQDSAGSREGYRVTEHVRNYYRTART